LNREVEPNGISDPIEPRILLAKILAAKYTYHNQVFCGHDIPTQGVSRSETKPSQNDIHSILNLFAGRLGRPLALGTILSVTPMACPAEARISGETKQ
jgi:hypothetical protein